jgi:dTDP-4-dehydrorhamnose 3,5-epimerase
MKPPNLSKNKTIKGVELTLLKIIDVQGGDVLHAMKTSDAGFAGFGEAYFSTIEFEAIKAWKRHRQMTLNLIVPTGAVRLVMYDDRPESTTLNLFQEVILSRENYYRLTIPPMVWLGFQGVGKGDSVMLNISDIKHQPHEADRLQKNQINYNWRECK